jgi:hypothetical protein
VEEMRQMQEAEEEETVIWTNKINSFAPGK